MAKKEYITITAIVINIILFSLKITGALLSNSLALVSDSFNSLLDILSSIAIYVAVKISSKKADYDHPFGHRRAEPIAALLVAILAAILGFEVIKDAVQSLSSLRQITITPTIFVMVVAGIILKGYLFVLFRRWASQLKSPALRASSIDYRNDILISFTVLIGNVLTFVGYPQIDVIIALAIGIFIIFSGIRIGLENIDYLMGKRPSEELVTHLKKIALAVNGVRDLNEVKAHYLGSFIQVEIHIEVDKNLITEDSHRIATEVQNRLQKEAIVDYAFVHVDPV